MKTSIRDAVHRAALAGGILVAIQAKVAAQDASHVASTIRAGTYAVEPTHTQVGFSLLHLGFSYYSGTFSGVSGTLRLDPANPGAARLDVTIPISSVATTSAKLDGELKGPAWFDATAHPDATFVSTMVTPTGKGTATITGTLTLHGVSKPETLTARFVGAGVNPLDKRYTIGFEATGLIQRSAFGVTTYMSLVGDAVRLTIAGAFELQG